MSEEEMVVIETLPLVDKKNNVISAEDLILSVLSMVDEEYGSDGFIGRELTVLTTLLAGIVAREEISEQYATQALSDETARTFLTKLSLVSFLLYKAMQQNGLKIDLDKIIEQMTGAAE